jgi:DNA-binding NtrC family response regulator
MESVTIPWAHPWRRWSASSWKRPSSAHKGDKGLASKLLGISTRTLYRKMDKKE